MTVQKSLRLKQCAKDEKCTLQSQMTEIRDRLPSVTDGKNSTSTTKVSYVKKVRVVSQAVVGQPPIHRVIIKGNTRAALNLRTKGILGRRCGERAPTGPSPNGHSAPERPPSKRHIGIERQAKTTYSPESHYLPQCPTDGATEISHTAFKKKAGKPKVRLTLLDVTSFLPKPKRSSAIEQSGTDSSPGDMLVGQSLLPVCQKNVSLASPRLQPSRPSFVELRQMRNQIIRSNLQRTQAWTTRDLSDRADLSGLTNYCDPEKTSMIMTWLQSERSHKGRPILKSQES